MGILSTEDSSVFQFQNEAVSDGRAIRCPRCQRVSFNIFDVAQKFCGACDDWHVNMPEVREPLLSPAFLKLRQGSSY